jgi:hypothetical protein
MSDAMGTVVAAIIAAIVGFITAWLISLYSFRQLKLELRANYRSELAKRQIDACESFWEVFGSASMTEGEHRIIRDFKKNPVLDIQETEAFIHRFQETFSSKAGLYVSQNTRRKLFEFRDILIALKTEAKENPEKVNLTHEQAAEVNALRTVARLALREEIGSTNLTVANTEFKAY